MPQEGFTLPELAHLAGVSTRTVRYYVSNGLLPAPGLGAGARYGDGHLYRLRLIRQLQRAHQPLAQIRSRLAALSDDEVRALVEEPVTGEESALDYVRGLLDRTRPRTIDPVDAIGVAPPAPASLSEPGIAFEPAAPSLEPYTAAPGALASRGPLAASTAPSQAPIAPGKPPVPAMAAPQPDRSQWDRIRLSPDVELHVRRPLDRLTNRQVERLIEAARQLLEEDQT